MRRLVGVLVGSGALLLALSVGGCGGGGGEEECTLADSRCEGDVAVACVSQSSGRFTPGENVLVRTDCATQPGTVCVSGQGVALCAADATPCDPSSFTPTCKDGLPLVCPDGDPSWPQFGDPCINGNMCIEGVCAAEDTSCDPVTWEPSCLEGHPTTCVSRSGAPPLRRVAFERECPASSPCLQGEGWAACSVDGERCDIDTFEPQCVDGLLTSCVMASVASDRDPIYLVLAYNCDNAPCSVVDGIAGCR